MRIIVLGGTGQIGWPVLLQLAAAHPGAELIGTSRSGQPKDWVDNRVQWLAFDPFQDDWAALGKADVVVNAIGIIRERGQMTFDKVHIELTRNILAARGAMGNPKIVQISALGADPNHEVDFLRTKGLADGILLKRENTAIIRPSIVCTPDTMLSKKMRTLRQIGKLMFGKLFVPKGFLSTRIQPILGTELANLIAKVCLDTPTGIIEVAGPEAMPFTQVIDWLADTGNVKLRPIEVPKEIMDSFVKYFVSVWFPGVISYDQFRLLFTDNISDRTDYADIMGRAPKDTEGFWRKEFALYEQPEVAGLPEQSQPPTPLLQSEQGLTEPLT